ncbi:hypothetical protein SHKM778_33390 [Streptomyces sp. KM77-8]|uniref:VWFA domain-containing protein n=1 Tax=Streptomyces haneummycinicus TaxID=3074435 RepID=A0AAT9HHH5_9ACTN
MGSVLHTLDEGGALGALTALQQALAFHHFRPCAEPLALRCGRGISASRRARRQPELGMPFELLRMTDPSAARQEHHVPYTAEISRSNPTSITFLVDQSTSMSDPIGGEVPQQKADVVADAINRLLTELSVKCAKEEGVRDYFHVAVVGYGATVGSAFAGSLAGRDIVPLSEVADNPARVDERSKKVSDGAGGLVETLVNFPLWMDPVAHGGTPMNRALQYAESLVAGWTERYPAGFPPIVINLTDGESTDGDPTAAAEAITSHATADGAALLFNLHVSAAGEPHRLPRQCRRTTRQLRPHPLLHVQPAAQPHALLRRLPGAASQRDDPRFRLQRGHHHGRAVPRHRHPSHRTAVTTPLSCVYVTHLVAPKHGSTEDECEDAVAVLPRRSHDDMLLEPVTAGVCDGATESALAKDWARLLSRAAAGHALEQPDLLAGGTAFEEFVSSAVAQWDPWLEQYTQARTEEGRPLKWYEHTKLAEGAYATLLTVRVDPDPGAEQEAAEPAWRWRAAALGDSCLFHLRDDRLLRAFPVETIDEFGTTPTFSAAATTTRHCWPAARGSPKAGAGPVTGCSS